MDIEKKMPTITLGRSPETPWAKMYIAWKPVYREMLKCWGPELRGKPF